MSRPLLRLALALFLFVGVLQAAPPVSAQTASDESLQTPAEEPPPDGEELVSERTASAKFFSNPDGTHVAHLYPEPIHFKDDQSEWEEIDTELVKRADGTWRNTANDFSLRLGSTAGASTLATMSDDGASVAFSMPDAAPRRGEIGDSSITYENVLPAVDLKIESISNGVKESIILKRAPSDAEQTSFEFPLKLAGLTATTTSSGDIELRDAAQRTQFVIPQGFMFDSRPATEGGPEIKAVDIRLETRDSSPWIVVDADRAWLTDPARVYPVVVDPTVMQDSTADTGVGSDITTTQEAAQWIQVGSPDGAAKRRMYLKFLNATDLAPYDILDVKLSLWQNHSAVCGNRQTHVHRPANGTSWTASNLKWTNQPAMYWNVLAATSSNRGGDGCATGDGRIYFGDDHFAATDDGGTTLTGLVSGWATGSVENNGLMVRALGGFEEDASYYKRFSSVETGHQPRLEVTYKDGSVTTDVAEWTTDTATGQTSYNFSVSASGLNLPGDPAGPCYPPARCAWHVQAKYTDGSESAEYGDYFGQGNLEENTASFAKTFSGTSSAEITHIRAWVESYRCPTGQICDQSWKDYDSGWIKVSDHYPKGHLSLSIGKWSRDPDTSRVEYELTVSASGASQFGGPCLQAGCRWVVEVRYENGGIFEFGRSDGYLAGGTWAFTEHLNGATTFPYRVTDLRAQLLSKCGNGTWCDYRRETYTTEWIPVSDFMLDEFDLAFVAASLAAQQVSLDELCLLVQDKTIVLGDPTPDSPTPAATACLGASTIRTALIAIAAVGGGALGIAAIIEHYSNGDSNADSVAKVPPTETDTAGSGVRPPTSCLSDAEKTSILSGLNEQNHHIATDKNKYWTQIFKDLLAQHYSDQSLDGPWNIMRIKHAGTHPPAYHFWTFRNMAKALEESAGDWDTFEILWQEWVVDVIRTDETIVRWEWWRC